MNRHHTNALSRKLFEIREFVEGQLIQAQRRQKEYYDRNSNLSDSMRFKEGDDVWVPIPHVGVAKKFENRWEGGWKVTEVKGPVNVSIQNRDGRIKTVHINRLQPHIRRMDDEYSNDTYSQPRVHKCIDVPSVNNQSIKERSKINESLVENSKLSTNTSSLLDTSPNASINDSVLSDVQWSPPSDHNSSISSSTPMKPTSHVVNVESTNVKSRAQRTRRMPKYLEDYQL